MGTTGADVLRGHFAAFADGGLDAVAEFWEPQVEWRAVEGAIDDVGLIQGPEALRRYYQNWIDTLDDLRAEAAEIIRDDGDHVAAVIDHSGRGRTSGVPVQGRYYVACVVRDGRILAGREYDNREQAREAVVPPPSAEALRAVFERFNETGEIDFEGNVDPEVELHDRPDVPDRQVWHGFDGVRGFLAKTGELFDPIRWEPQELIATGRHVIARVHVVAYGASSGTPIEMDEAMLWTFRDGLIVRLQGFSTVAEAEAMARALDEAGGAEPADPLSA